MYNGLGVKANRLDRLEPARIAHLSAGCSADIGQALYAAQQGDTDPSVKPLRGFGGGVLEVIAQHRGDTWRAIYTVGYPEAVYVLHAFQKKSKRGIATPKKEMDLIRQRLNEAERIHREKQN